MLKILFFSFISLKKYLIRFKIKFQFRDNLPEFYVQILKLNRNYVSDKDSFMMQNYQLAKK